MGIWEEKRWPIQRMYSYTRVHPNSSSRLHRELTPVVTDDKLCVILLVWFINKCYSQTIYVETAFIYTVLEEEIYMIIPGIMAEVPEEHYVYKDILTQIKSSYGALQSAR